MFSPIDALSEGLAKSKQLKKKQQKKKTKKTQLNNSVLVA